jgi:hypothetical protein
MSFQNVNTSIIDKKLESYESIQNISSPDILTSDNLESELKSSQGYFIEKNEHGYLTATFTSSLKSHSIKVEIDLSQKELMINSMNIQHHSPVELTLMLKKMVNDMKKLNIIFVVQQVTKSDWITILRSQRFFSFVNENKQHNFITVKCPIDKFPEAVIHGLGFSDINMMKSKMQNHYNPEEDQDNEY